MLCCRYQDYAAIPYGYLTIESKLDPSAAASLRDFIYKEAHKSLFSDVSERFGFRPWSDFSQATSCILCRAVGELSRTQFANVPFLDTPGVALAIGLPFPSVYYDAKARSGSETFTINCVVPILAATKAADGSDYLITLVLEMRLRYESQGCGLRDIKPWNRSTIDIGPIQSWLTNCQNHHDDNCTAKLDNTTPLPPAFRLIDTANWCIAFAPPDASYLALSYVWASASPPPQTQIHPFQLQQPTNPLSLNPTPGGTRAGGPTRNAPSRGGISSSRTVPST